MIIDVNTRIICTGWIGTGSVPATGDTFSTQFTIYVNSTVTWTWSFIDKYGDADKVIIGKKPGEKMYEEIMTDEESFRAFENDEMYVINPYIGGPKDRRAEGFTPVEMIKNSSEMDVLTKDEISKVLAGAGL